jgi:FtsZ-binding cell division protein ZapB
MKEEKQNINISSKTAWIVGSSIILFIIILGVLYINSRSKMNEFVEVMTEEKMALTLDYQNLAVDYDSLKTNNSLLNEKLEQERERVSNLLEELKTVKATNALKIRELKKELSTLRTVMKNFVVQIDSLNQRNEALTQENKDMRTRVTRIQDSYKVLEKQKETLAAKVEIASKLETANIKAGALTSGDRGTDRISRAAKLQVCFDILKNVSASVGKKDVFLRISRPDGALLMHSIDDKFKFEDSMINFSSKRNIEYGGEDINVCIFYNVDQGELLAGEYTAEIFADGNLIGTTRFKLK